MDRSSHEGLTNGSRPIVLDRYSDNVGQVEGFVLPGNEARKSPDRDFSPSRVGPDVFQELSQCNFRTITVGGGHGHELEARCGRFIEDLDRVSGSDGGGIRWDRLEGADYGGVHEVSDRAVETEDEVVLGRPPRGDSRVGVEGGHHLIRQVWPDDVSYFSE